MTLYIAAPAEPVWEAIVGDDGNRALMFGSVLRSDLKQGSRYEYVGPGEDGAEVVHVYGEVLEIEPGTLLSLSEHPGPSYDEKHAERESRMTWRLTKESDALTKLEFTNDHWSEGNPSAAASAETWPRVLSSLKTLVETGKPIDFGW